MLPLQRCIPEVGILQLVSIRRALINPCWELHNVVSRRRRRDPHYGEGGTMTYCQDVSEAAISKGCICCEEVSCGERKFKLAAAGEWPCLLACLLAWWWVHIDRDEDATSVPPAEAGPETSINLEDGGEFAWRKIIANQPSNILIKSISAV